MAFNEKARETVRRKNEEKRAAKREALLAAQAGVAQTAGLAPVAQTQPVAAIPVAPAPAAAGAAAVEPSPQAPPRNLFTGQVQKLAVFGKPGTDPNKPVPGHELYWFDDIQDGMVISQAKASGWQFVQKEEIALNDAPVSPGNTDLGGNVRRWVSNAGGQPIYSYLMKKPDWLYQLHMEGPDSLEQRVHMQLEERLRTGTLNDSPDQRRYTAATVPAGYRSLGHVQPIVMGRSRRSP